MARWVGEVPLGALAPYASMAPVGPKRAAEAIDPVLPALRKLA